MIERVGLYNHSDRKRPWVVRWYEQPDVTGKARRLSKSFRIKREAERFRSARQKAFDDGAKRNRPAKINLGLLCEKVVAIRKPNLRYKTIICYENTIKQLKSYFGPSTSLQKIGPEQAARFIASRKLVHKNHRRQGKELSAWGRNQHLEIASTIFGEAVAWGYLASNPFAGIRRTKQEGSPWHHITPAEFEAILRVTPDIRSRVLYSIMYGTGLRFGEAINLLWNGRDIDFERGRVDIAKREGTPEIPPFFVKDKERRSIPLPQWTLNLLLEFQAEAGEGRPFVFLTPDRWEKVKVKWKQFQREGRSSEWQNTDLCNNTRRDLQARCRRAGITTSDKLNVHCLRKSYAQNLADSGTPIHTLRKLMGHSSVRTLESFYIRSSDANEIEARETLDRLFPSKLDRESKMEHNVVRR